MSYYNKFDCIKKSGIVGTVSGSTLIDTTLNGTQRFHPMMAVMILKSMSGLITVPTVSIGTNATSYNNIASGIIMTNLNAVNKMFNSYIAGSAMETVPPNTSIYVNVTSIAIASTFEFDIVLFGFYE